MNMSGRVETDEIDRKVLSALIKNSRAKLKDIAKNCGVSSVTVLHRIKRLEELGVITGATLFPNLRELGLIAATLGIDVEAGQEEEILALIEKQTNLVEPALSFGKYDLCALIFADNLSSLENITQLVRKHSGVKRITTNMWVSKPAFNFENIDLQCGKANSHG
jgi:DNA-binding Lrp family transcriptional regulator